VPVCFRNSIKDPSRFGYSERIRQRGCASAGGVGDGERISPPSQVRAHPVTDRCRGSLR
jgi:hypothetical protein